MPTVAHPRVIGFTGYAFSGKDTAASGLSFLGYTSIQMSELVDLMLRKIDPKYDQLRNHVAYSQAKKIEWVRVGLQTLGTEVGRELDPHLWIRALLARARLRGISHLAITGIRFQEEVDACDLLVHIDRPGYGPVNRHVSEALAPIFEQAALTFSNSGTPLELGSHVRHVIEDWQWPRPPVRLLEDWQGK